MTPPAVELHPESGLPMIEAAGAWRVLGCLPPAPALGASAQLFGAERVLPPAQWRECNYHADWPAVKTEDQGKSESCVGHAVKQVMSYAWLQAGQKFKTFSPTFVYGIINHGVDRGASITDAMNALKLFGICEASLVPEGMIFRSQFPAAAFANAKRFKPSDCLSIRSFDQLCSSLTVGFTVATGILVGPDLGQLDDEGVCPVPKNVVGGHAVTPVGLKYSPRRKDWLVLFQNSWSETWGFKDQTGTGGFGYLCRDHFTRCFFDTWAVGGVQSDPEDLSDDLPVAS